MQVNVHCWIVTKVAPSNGALGVMSCVHLAQTCSHRIHCFACCLHEGRNAPWSSQGPQQKFKSPALLPRKRRLLDVGELAICSTELVQRVPRLIDLEGCDDISSAVDHADKKEAVIAAIKLSVFCCLWYLFIVQYNIQHKLLLEVFPVVLAVSFIQLLCGTLIALFLWASGILQTPKVCCRIFLLAGGRGQFTNIGACISIVSDLSASIPTHPQRSRLTIWRRLPLVARRSRRAK